MRAREAAQHPRRTITPSVLSGLALTLAWLALGLATAVLVSLLGPVRGVEQIEQLGGHIAPPPPIPDRRHSPSTDPDGVPAPAGALP